MNTAGMSQLKISEKCVSCNGIRAHFVGTFGNFTVGGVRKIQGDKHPFTTSVLSTS